MDLVPGDIISDCIAFTGVYEPVLTRRLIQLARRGGLLVDVGANLGYFALLWVASNPLNKCVAFEASPRNVEILRRNVRQNCFQKKIEVIASAAGASPGAMPFDIGPPDQTGWGGLTLEASDRFAEVDVVRVDEVVGPISAKTLLKVDIEGADTWALMGCERLLRNGLVGEIWYEQNKPRMAALGIPANAPQDYLRSVGYVATPRSGIAGDVVEWSAVPQKVGSQPATGIPAGRVS
jgi:FkbM family methyltransferase